MNDWTRREFLAASALAVAQAEAPKKAGEAGKGPPSGGGEPKRAPTSVAPAEKIVLGFIGVGGMGTGLINTFKAFPDVEIAAVCDVYEPHLAPRPVSGGWNAGDLRRFSPGARPQRHRRGRDRHSRPLARDSHHSGLPGRQGRLLREAAGAPHPGRPGHGPGGRKVQARHPDGQLDPRRRKLPPCRRDRSLGRPGKDQPRRGSGWRPTAADWDGPPDGSPPPGCDYDFWLGPAPSRAFNPNRFTFNWRYFWDYGGGILTDFCCHIVDLVHWAMDVDAPHTISAVGGRYALDDNAEVPDTLDVTYEYQKGDQKFLMVWSQTDASTHGLENKGLGIMFQGTDATLVADYDWYRIIPEKGRKIDEPAQEPAAIGGPSSRVVGRDQVARPVLVQFRLRPPPGERRQPGQHLALDRRKAHLGPGRRADHQPSRRPTST